MIPDIHPVFLSQWQIAVVGVFAAVCPVSAREAIDFNRDIRPILSENCFKCHGPDENKREGGSSKTGKLRLDTTEGATMDLGGYAALVPGNPEESELYYLITTEDEDDRMPPAKERKRLDDSKIALIKQWIEEGGEYARHWSYQKPRRPPVPAIGTEGFTLNNPIDHFVAGRLVSENLSQSPEADRYALARRVALDLTGLPPSLEEVETFVNDQKPMVYERFVQQQLDKPAYGEHWARMWLDLARYADSAGYADDPLRTIWAFRDYVIRSFNENKPFDQFTMEQIAGDLQADPDTDQLVATAFHRNTQTNNEGGTNDEEFRNEAVVDRVNTTMAVWMGTTINCAQCHTHKYDPISQEEYFQMFAIFNNSADEDRKDEAPFIPIYTGDQKKKIQALEAEINGFNNSLKNRLSTKDNQQRRYDWEEQLLAEDSWHVLRPASSDMKANTGASLSTDAEGIIQVGDNSAPTDTYQITSDIPGKLESVTGIRLEVLPLENSDDPDSGQNQNFVLNELEVIALKEGSRHVNGRYVRIEMEGTDESLKLAEVEVFSEGKNIASQGTSTQSSTVKDRGAELAIDGETGSESDSKTVSETGLSENPWWELELPSLKPMNKIVVWNQVTHFKLSILDNDRQTLWEKSYSDEEGPKVVIQLDEFQKVKLARASASYEQDQYSVELAFDGVGGNSFSGWAVDGNLGVRNEAVFELAKPLEVTEEINLQFKIVHNFQNRKMTRFRISLTGKPDPMPAIPQALATALAKGVEDRTDREETALLEFFTRFDPESKQERMQIADLQARIDAIKPLTTVPVMREVPETRIRKAHIQHRGNFMDKGPEVTPGLPSAFHSLPEGERSDRHGLARWLINRDNPLTARVVANRYWEALFGVGIVSTSEEFGSQGELPSHPELLDWLAVELMESGWNLKHLLKLMVTSATYRQSSKVDPALYSRDPDNRLLARGPRFRISAEMVRDQALAVSGLLSYKLYGPPVNPPQPELGLKAAFGGKTDWTTSKGNDKYRRGIYTSWRRSNPYPSMVAFDAPNREFCTVRRDRTNTPLQALVTLNDPVYIEAAQALGRRMLAEKDSTDDKAARGFQLCLTRLPTDKEVAALTRLFQATREHYATAPEEAIAMATDPLGPLPKGGDAVEYAAWTVVGNALLNLDELFLKR